MCLPLRRSREPGELAVTLSSLLWFVAFWQGREGPVQCWCCVAAALVWLAALAHSSACGVSLPSFPLPACLQFLKNPARAAMGDGYQPREPQQAAGAAAAAAASGKQ